MSAISDSSRSQADTEAHLKASASPSTGLNPSSYPITAPKHSWMVSPARSYSNSAQARELPLHLIQLVLSHLDHVADLARVTRTSRLFYYMTLPRLYENVTLRSYSEIRYVDGRPEGYGGGSPFAMGLNTLVSRNFTDYVQSFRMVGDWREHDMDEYKQGRVPDNSMMLQIATRAALDKMKNIQHFAWELNTKPLSTVYQGLVNRASTLTSLTLRCPTKRIPQPTVIIAPLPNLITLVLYDIDPLCYPDDISLLLLGAQKLENLKLHWSPRMREAGEESINLLSMFAHCIAAQKSLRLKRMAFYNLYARFIGKGFDNVVDPNHQEEITIFNSLGSADPMTVFLDDSWRVNNTRPIPQNLKMLRTDATDKDQAKMLSMLTGLERLYLVSKRKSDSKTTSTAVSPSTPSTIQANGNGTSSANGTPTVTEKQCRNIGGEYLAALQTNHRSLRHLLLVDQWHLTTDALKTLCKSCPNLEQIGFSCSIPPFDAFRQIMSSVPKLWAMRMLIAPGSEFANFIENSDPDMHAFALATEFWRPEYRNLKYVGVGDKFIFKLGRVVRAKDPPKIPEGEENSLNAKRAGPIRVVEVVSRESVEWIEIWGMDTVEFDPSFP